MPKKIKGVLAIAAALVAAIGAAIYLTHSDIAVLSPSGPVGAKERNLIILAIGLSAIVVIPVYVMLVAFAWRYRESNKKARYQPQFEHSRLIESIWWGVPLAIILVLAVAAFKSSHELDPFKPLSSNRQPITIQAIALDWKWLFIYPQQNIASVNLVEFPANTPVNFQITSDAPMNSFWIPKLGGQIYAMNGMATQLNLMADKPGDYYGSSANISGEGFSSMNFTARAATGSSFESWVKKAKKTTNKLDLNSYSKLSQPSKNNPVSYYAAVDNNVFNTVLNKFYPYVDVGRHD